MASSGGESRHHLTLPPVSSALHFGPVEEGVDNKALPKLLGQHGESAGSEVGKSAKHEVGNVLGAKRNRHQCSSTFGSGCW
jgi:hypothetical protein